MKELKDLIKTRRLEIGKTLEQIGKEVGVAKATVQRWESGEIKDMRQGKLVALAKALDTTPAYLMGWEEIKDTPFGNDEHILQRMNENPKLRDFIYYIVSLDDDQLKMLVDDTRSIYEMIVAARGKK